jgi:superfamily I DNA/RNA helicase
MYMMNTLYILLISGFSEDHISSRICTYSKADEYQDSNYVQEQILLQLARPSNNIFA